MQHFPVSCADLFLAPSGPSPSASGAIELRRSVIPEKLLTLVEQFSAGATETVQPEAIAQVTQLAWGLDGSGVRCGAVCNRCG